jgi:hypothetical protein
MVGHELGNGMLGELVIGIEGRLEQPLSRSAFISRPFLGHALEPYPASRLIHHDIADGKFPLKESG